MPTKKNKKKKSKNNVTKKYYNQNLGQRIFNIYKNFI